MRGGWSPRLITWIPYASIPFVILIFVLGMYGALTGGGHPPPVMDFYPPGVEPGVKTFRVCESAEDRRLALEADVWWWSELCHEPPSVDQGPPCDGNPEPGVVEVRDLTDIVSRWPPPGPGKDGRTLVDHLTMSGVIYVARDGRPCILRHEIGHVLGYGVDHTTAATSVMAEVCGPSGALVDRCER